MTRYDIAIVGSGFAGSILARLLALAGRRVALLERGVHPRFALGESSTPLAAISLERIARRFDQEDLRMLAAHGRWKSGLPQLRCGLKRGFSFYRHLPGEPLARHLPGESPARRSQERLLVAASPDDAIADCQWMRSDVDEHLVAEAVRTGVEYLDRTELVGATMEPDRVCLTSRREGEELEIEAELVIDASGGGRALSGALGLPSRTDSIPFSSELLYCHFDGVGKLADAVSVDRARDPFPEDWSAAHHLLDEGWMYILRFDDGRVSAGLVLDSKDRAPGPNPEQEWSRTLGRYPSLQALFDGARALAPGIRHQGRLQRRETQAAGDLWALLPQSFAFYDPMFSTGMAWSLTCVERLFDVVLCEGDVRRARLRARELQLQSDASAQFADTSNETSGPNE